MGVEEQKEEREVLDSIFPEEITDIADNSFRISISLDAPASDDSGVSPPTILLTVTYPEAYPDVSPHLELSSPPNAAKYPYLDVADDKVQLLESLTGTIEDSMGMSMVFSIVSTLKDSAEVLIADRQRHEEEIKQVEAQKVEEQENRKFHGTVVTRERFLEWREKFKKEMEEKEKADREAEEAEEKKKRGGKLEEKKLTGKQLWEQGMVGKGDAEGDDGDDHDNTAAGVVEDIDKLKVTT